MQLTCIYLFHELPPEARKQAATEMARVMKPGGVVVITDSVQLGDRPDTDAARGMFGGFNEPFYESYIISDLGACPSLRPMSSLKAEMRAGLVASWGE